MRVIDGLQISLWIPVVKVSTSSDRAGCSSVPIAVVENDNISRGQVNTQSSCTRCEQEQELVAVGLVVFINGRNTVFVASATVNAAVPCKKSCSS